MACRGTPRRCVLRAGRSGTSRWRSRDSKGGTATSPTLTRSAAPSRRRRQGNRPRPQVCILVDQFEELFRYAREISRDESQLFIELFAGLPKDNEDFWRPCRCHPALGVSRRMRHSFGKMVARFDEVSNRHLPTTSRMFAKASSRAPPAAAGPGSTRAMRLDRFNHDLECVVMRRPYNRKQVVRRP